MGALVHGTGPIIEGV